MNRFAFVVLCSVTTSLAAQHANFGQGCMEAVPVDAEMDEAESER
jgi:hypothetical protein